MNHFFSPIHKKHTLYNVIPLSLNPKYREEHLSTISQESDCLLLEHFDVTKKKFSFFKKNVSLFSNYTQKGTKFHFQVPFTTLLVGPAYSCKRLLQSYFFWAHSYNPRYHSFTRKKISSSNNSKESLSSFRKNTKEQSSFKGSQQWHKLSPSHVWAKASLSNVELPCVAPHTLKKELCSFFDYSINVTAVPIQSGEKHNELFSWVCAFYCLLVARHVGRHVFFHYKNISDQYSLYYKTKPDGYISLPRSWSNITTPTSYNSDIKYIPLSKTKSPSLSPVIKTCVKRVLEKSNYVKKEVIYSFTKDKTKCIGFSCVTDSILKQTKVADGFALKKYTIKLTKEDGFYIFSLPFLPSYNTLNALKNIASVGLSVDKDLISFTIDKDVVLPSLNQEYSLLGNLLLQIIQKKVQRNNTIKTSIPKYIYKNRVCVSCVLEFSIKKYNPNINLKNVYINVHAGHIASEQFVLGHIENIVNNEVDSFIGYNQHLVRSYPPSFDISFTYTEPLSTKKSKKEPVIQENYTSSLSSIVQSAVQNSAYMAISSYYKNQNLNISPHISFPKEQLFMQETHKKEYI